MLARAIWDCCCKHSTKDPSVPGPVSIKVLNEEEVEASLLEACDRGDLDAVEGLLVKRANPNARAEDGSPSCRDATPLVTASRRGHVSVLYRLLMEPGIEVNAVTQDDHNQLQNGQSALHWACTAGHPAVTRALLGDLRTEREAMTHLGFTPLMLAAQLDHVDVVKIFLQARTDVNLALNVHGRVRTTALTLAIAAGNTATVRALLESGQIRINEQFCHIHAAQCSALDLAVVHKRSSLVRMLLKFSADPDLADERGVRALQRAVSGNAAEIVMILLLFGADAADVFTPVRRLQVLGDAPKLKSLLASSEAQSAGSDRVPTVHKAALENNVELARQHIADHGAAACSVLDEGSLPAIYYALSLGHIDIMRFILQEGYGFNAEVVAALEAVVVPATKSPSTQQDSLYAVANLGERAYVAVKVLLAEELGVCCNPSLVKGAHQLISTWCGSTSALGFFAVYPEAFIELCGLCEERLRDACIAADREVTLAGLRSLMQVGRAERTSATRQDAPGLLPAFEYFVNEPLRQKMGGDHEVFAARTLSVLGLALHSVFRMDILNVFSAYADKVNVAAPKTFKRMLNKLLNPADINRSEASKPSMRNMDVLRLRMHVANSNELLEVYKLMDRSFRLLNVVNTHNPDTMVSRGRRSVVVTFAYDSHVTFKDLFGDTGTGTGESTMSVQDHWGRIWLSLVKTWGDTLDVKWCLQALWYTARQQPNRSVVIAAEAEIILDAYTKCIELKELLSNIQRCESGPAEMIRDLAPSSFKIDSNVDVKVLEMAKSRAMDIRTAIGEQPTDIHL
mmetsp:Transcript_25575/g.59080  ORF Transcript_25575/g.59080 Transcript_25575/m.59080 type:complete len:797 (-) Transcript_25575:8-2398(-)